MLSWKDRAWIIHTAILKEHTATERDRRFLCLALAGEVGELANLIKKQWREEFGFPPSENLTPKIIDELADINAYLYLLARTYGIDLDIVTAKKMAIVAERYGPDVREAIARAEYASTTLPGRGFVSTDP